MLVHNMINRTRSIIMFPLVLLAILALMTFWINKAVQPPAPKTDGSSRHDPDYIISHFVTTQTDINGTLRYKLAATEMKHFSDDDSAVLQRPRYTQFAVNKPYTQIQGLYGNVSSNGEVIELFNNVKVTRQAFAGKGEMTVETDYLNILPNQELVRTASPVVIRQAPRTVIYATGMLYEKKNKTVTLLHKVRAHYERPPTSKTAKNIANKTLTRNKKTTPSAQNQPKLTRTKDARIRRRYE